MRTRSRAPRGALVFFIVFLFSFETSMHEHHRQALRRRIPPGGAGPLAGWLITLDERTESAEGARVKIGEIGGKGDCVVGSVV